MRATPFDPNLENVPKILGYIGQWPVVEAGWRAYPGQHCPAAVWYQPCQHCGRLCSACFDSPSPTHEDWMMLSAIPCWLRRLWRWVR